MNLVRILEEGWGRDLSYPQVKEIADEYGFKALREETVITAYKYFDMVAMDDIHSTIPEVDACDCVHDI